jgi:hypothetical protein
MEVRVKNKGDKMEKLFIVKHLDAWGNEDDGWEVNDCRTEGEIRLDPDRDDIPMILAKLQDDGHLNSDMTVRELEEALDVVWDDETYIEITDSKTGCPVYQLWAYGDDE